MEIWDGYNVDGTLAGVDLVRGEPIPDGIYNLVVEILVRHRDGDYLLMRRSLDKDAFPGYYEATAGGAAKKGEDPYSAAIRELHEETGISTDSLIEIRHLIFRHMICYQYLCVTDSDKSAIALQDGETMDYKWVNESDFISFITSDEMIPTQKERYTPYFEQLGYI